MMIDDDSSAYSESLTRVECTSREDRRVRATSSAPGTTDPFCGFCLVTTPNTRGETVEQSLYMDVCARIYNELNRHPKAPQTNKQTNARTDISKTQLYCDEDR